MNARKYFTRSETTSSLLANQIHGIATISYVLDSVLEYISVEKPNSADSVDQSIQGH